MVFGVGGWVKGQNHKDEVLSSRITSDSTYSAQTYGTKVEQSAIRDSLHYMHIQLDTIAARQTKVLCRLDPRSVLCR